MKPPLHQWPSVSHERPSWRQGISNGFAHKLTKYSECSGALTEGQTYEYATAIRASSSLYFHPSSDATLFDLSPSQKSLC